MSTNTNKEGGLDHHVTTAFVDDGVSLTLPFNSGEEDDIVVRATSIPEFLAKPQLIATGVWSTASSENTVLETFSVSNKLLTTAIWIKKLETFNLFRGTACVRIQINANPFQQGRLLFHFLPCVAQLKDAGTPVEELYNVDIVVKSTQAHIEIDARDTSAVIKVPYVTPAHFFDRANGGYDWGNFYLSVMSPMKTGAAGDVGVDYSIFMWFEDFELAAPSFTQSSMKGMGKTKGRKMAKFSAGIESEKKAMPGTPIADVLGNVATAASTLGSVPIIGAFMGQVSWAANLASGVASIFGWSKAPINVVPGIMAKQQERYSASSDGAETAYPLSLTCDNHLGINDCCSIRGEDEMSFAFLKSKSALVNTFEWTTSDAAGTSKYTKLISPYNLSRLTSRVIGASTAVYSTGPPINYMADQFQLWRGSIKVRISLVKTIFHSGRLMITFNPIVGMGYTQPAITLAGSTPMLREIIDIRECNEIELILPFYSPTNYLNWDEVSGSLNITVMSELRVPESASNSISALVFYSGGDDLELQVPRATTLGGPYTTQSGQVLISRGIGGDPTKRLTTTFAEQSVGEMFMSIKQILARFSVVASSLPLATPPSNQAAFIWPYSTNVTRSLPAVGTLINSAIGADAYTLYSPLYAFYRGSMKIRCRTTSAIYRAYTDPSIIGSGGAALAVGYTPVPGTTTWGNSPWAASGSQNPTALGVVAGLDTVEFPALSIPYAGRYHCSLVAPQVGTTVLAFNPVPYSTGKAQLEKSQSLNVCVLGELATGISTLHKSIGDDFQFSYFMGCVPRLISKI